MTVFRLGMICGGSLEYFEFQKIKQKKKIKNLKTVWHDFAQLFVDIKTNTKKEKQFYRKLGIFFVNVIELKSANFFTIGIDKN